MSLLRNGRCANVLTLRPVIPARSFFGVSPLNSACTHKISRVVPCSATEMFGIVADVARYKEFLPFVIDSFINQHSDAGYATEAGLRVGWRLFDERFVCKLQCDPDKLVVAKSETHSLFDHLSTVWTFEEKKALIPGTGDLCIVRLDLSYQFKNPLYNTVSSAFSKQVSSIMIDAFENRVKQLKINRLSRRIMKQS